MWLIFTIINMIIIGVIGIIKKKNSNDQALQFWAIAVFLYGLFNVILGIIFYPEVVFSFDIKTFLYTLSISLFATLGYYCSIKSLQNSDISKVFPIMKSKTILVLILSSIFLKDETLSIIQIILIFVILILNILLNSKKSDNKTFNGILYAIGFLIFNGTSTFIEKVVMNIISNPVSITFYVGLTSLLSIFMILLIFGKFEYLNFKKFNNKKQIIILELLEVVGMLLTRYALIDGNVVIITAITSCSVLITIILSVILLKEKISIKKWILIILITLMLTLLSIASL